MARVTTTVRPGVTQVRDDASINVFKIVMRRQRSLRGVKVTVHPSQGSNYEIAL